MTLTPAQLIEGREYLGLTQEQIADALGVTRQTVHRYESGARPASEAYVKGLREACELKMRPPAPVTVAVAGFDLNTPGGLKALAKNVDKLAQLPPKDFENLTVRLNEIIATTYDEKLKVRGLDILAKLTLASAKVGGMPSDTPPATDQTYDLAGFTDLELNVFHALDAKARGEVQNPDLPWVRQVTEALAGLERAQG